MLNKLGSIAYLLVGRSNILILCVVLLSLAPNAFARGPLNDTIIAVVNNDVITLKDLSMYINSIRSELKIENKSQQEIHEIMAEYEERGINKLIEDKLILAAAEEKGIIIRDEILNKRVREIRSKYASEDEFLQILNSQGMTVSDLRKKLANQLRAKFTVDLEVREKVFVNPQDVTKYFNENAHEFERKTRYNLQSIYVSFDAKSRQEANNSIAQARARIMAGEDFDKVNSEYSEAPSIGTLEQGQMVPAIEDQVFKLKLGDLSEPIEVDGGVYLFKVVGISPGRQQTIKEVKQDIYNKLFDQQFEKKFNDWIEKLRKKAYVDIKE